MRWRHRGRTTRHIAGCRRWHRYTEHCSQLHQRQRRTDRWYRERASDGCLDPDPDTPLEGGLGIETLKFGASFPSASDAHSVGIENIVLTGGSNIRNLTNQTEAFTITGSAGDDKIIRVNSADVISGGLGNDSLVGGQGNGTGVDGVDQFRLTTLSGTDIPRRPHHSRT